MTYVKNLVLCAHKTGFRALVTLCFCVTLHPFSGCAAHSRERTAAKTITNEGPGKAPKTIENMKRFVKMVCLSLSILTLMPLQAGAANGNDSSEQFDWTPVMEAIILVESEGNPNAVSGNSVGVMQITPILVRECNNILKARRIDKRYTLADRYNVEKSKEMFLLIQSEHNKQNDVERAIRMWNGGPRYSNRATNGYYQKVLRRMR